MVILAHLIQVLLHIFRLQPLDSEGGDDCVVAVAQYISGQVEVLVVHRKFGQRSCVFGVKSSRKIFQVILHKIDTSYTLIDKNVDY